MPKEKESYRDNLERINAAFPNKEMLNKKEVSQFTGLNIKTVCKMFDFKENYISKAKLAREMS